MRNKRKLVRGRAGMYLTLLVVMALTAVLVLGGYTLGVAQQASPPPTYLVVSSYDMAPGRTINDVIEEASGWVRAYRQTGEFNSVRLFIHDWGSGLRVFVLTEPKSWQSIKTGNDKFFAARPDILTAPFRWQGHSDDILTEVPVR
jgi:hypothetical protein